MHYRDGTEAKLNDVIRGKPYNTPHEVIGVVVELRPHMGDSCNLEVVFATTLDVDPYANTVLSVQGHDHATQSFTRHPVVVKKDSGACGDFGLVRRPGA